MTKDYTLHISHIRHHFTCRLHSARLDGHGNASSAGPRVRPPARVRPRWGHGQVGLVFRLFVWLLPPPRGLHSVYKGQMVPCPQRANLMSPSVGLWPWFRNIGELSNCFQACTWPLGASVQRRWLTRSTTEERRKRRIVCSHESWI